MMNINISSDINNLTKYLHSFQRQQIPFAASKTLNQVAYHAARREMPTKAEMIFQGGATNWTKQGFKYKKSNKSNLMAEVFIDTAQKKYMKFMVSGGTRFPEKRAVLVSTKYSRLNKYGNFPKNYVKNIIGDKKKFFSGQPKGHPNAPPGIWERYGRSSKGGGQRIRIVALYTDQAQYQPLFPFGKFTEGVVFSRDNGFAVMFRKNLLDALRSAR